MAKIKIYQEVEKHHTVELLAEINTTLEDEIDIKDLTDAFRLARYPQKGYTFAVIEKDENYDIPLIRGCKTINDRHSYSELNKYKVVNSWV